MDEQKMRTGEKEEHLYTMEDENVKNKMPGLCELRTVYKEKKLPKFLLDQSNWELTFEMHRI